ncbi:hypothetical protein SAMN04515671_0136 [Nakamurella panacisegetis]|uniref:ThuA-like domain-containing protein n=1 Tax=Nakamurella panacisegetis TaxID=1090615 RepID=A0A1H0HMV4_9ACTN|nr:ThuA domain-containing protein [Nakamurella panacisegetis]SDO20528.1 hypothetical protein SAMN04515671_0136 [Nakamurella panacisegetis]
MTRRRALIVRGGWPGHRPTEMTDLIIPFLERSEFEVTVSESLQVYADPEAMTGLDLIVQCWTLDEIDRPALTGLIRAVSAGTGFAGWHGGIADSFRNSTHYLQMVGGQFVAHPGNFVDHEVVITQPDHPIVEGLSTIRLNSEQYWVLTDEYNDVLATTTLPVGENTRWRRPVTCPAIWTRQWGAGRVFVTTIGHHEPDFEMPDVRTVVERGMVWASR